MLLYGIEQISTYGDNRFYAIRSCIDSTEQSGAGRFNGFAQRQIVFQFPRSLELVCRADDGVFVWAEPGVQQFKKGQSFTVSHAFIVNNQLSRQGCSRGLAFFRQQSKAQLFDTCR